MTRDDTRALISVRQIIWNKVEQSEAGAAVSVNEIMKAVRLHVPFCPLTDKELATLIGAVSIAAGRNVYFEGSGIDMYQLGNAPAGHKNTLH